MSDDLETEKEMIKKILDIFAETGDKKFIYVKKMNDFFEKMNDVAMNDEISDEKFEVLSDALEQFSEMFDMKLKEELK